MDKDTELLIVNAIKEGIDDFNASMKDAKAFYPSTVIIETIGEANEETRRLLSHKRTKPC